MKKLLALLLACLLVVPAAAMAQSTNDSRVQLTYNGQTYDCSITYFPKCCGEIDTSFDLWIHTDDEAVGKFNLNFPSSVRAGDTLRVNAGESMKWLSLSASRPEGAVYYVPPHGSIFGTGLVAEGDFFEVTIHQVEYEMGIAHIVASVQGRFLDGEAEISMELDVYL